MAMKGKWVFAGIEMEGAYAFVHHVTAGKMVGVNATICVYPREPIPAVEEVKDGDTVVTPAKPIDRGQHVEQVSLSTPYVPGEDSVATAYKAMAKDERFKGFVSV